jgi:DNA-binding transcriptional LysR family regulator
VEFSRQPLMVAIHPNAAPKRKLTAQTYAALKHVAVAPRQHEPSPVDEALEALGLHRIVLLTLPSAHAALVAAARGELTATVPERIAQATAPRLGLQLLKLPFAVAADPVLMAWHPRQVADPAHRWLRECVLRLRTDPSLAKPQLLSRNRKATSR